MRHRANSQMFVLITSKPPVSNRYRLLVEIGKPASWLTTMVNQRLSLRKADGDVPVSAFTTRQQAQIGCWLFGKDEGKLARNNTASTVKAAQ